MFVRKTLDALRKWRDSEQRKPLVLRGARQVGKTTLVNEFGREFENYLSFNLERAADAALFERELSVDALVDALFALRGQPKREGRTLIFIDEIQHSARAMARLRYFYEERPDLHIVAAGSLLENVVDVGASFPVGRVEFMALRPCSFAEFLGAMGKDNLLYFADRPEESVAVHSELLSLFNQYVVVGGMPEAVQHFADHRDIVSLDAIYEALLQGYRDDVEKYVRGRKLAEVVRFVIERGWMQAGEVVTLGGFAHSDYRAREVGEAFRLLEKAMLAELVYPTTAVAVPAMGETKRMPKLFWLDTGLVNYQAGVRRELIGAADIIDVWRGRIAEQVVAQELLALSDKVSTRRCYWVKGSGTAEVDFVWTHNSRLYPVEVKSGRNSHLRSLHTFIDAAPIDVGIRVWSGAFSVEEQQTAGRGKPFRLINLPFYLLCRLPDIVERVAQ